MVGLKYTKQQLRAIGHRDGNLQIIACAGSGKTEVISRRIAEIVREGTPKSSIVAFTFTDRAALELKARIRKHLEELCPDDPSLGDMYVGTIHSFSLQLLKEIDPKYRNFEVIDDARQAALIYSNYRGSLGLEDCPGGKSGQAHTVERFIDTLDILYLEDIPDDGIGDANARNAVKAYRRLTLEPPSMFLDYNGIIGVLVRELRGAPEKLSLVRQRFKHIVADEYQDFDPRQEELLSLISDTGRSACVCVVGDDDQAIYGWRGADIGNMLEFSNRYPNVERVNMVYNFRSTHAIVEIANASVNRLQERLAKQMEARHWGADKDAGIPEETLAEEGDVHRRYFDSRDKEARYVAKRVKELLGVVIREKDGSERAIAYSDMAVLLRSVKSVGREFADVLRAEGIPVVVRGTRGLFTHPEIRLVQAAFCQLAGIGYMVETGFRKYTIHSIPATREIIRTIADQLRSSGAMPTADGNVLLGWIAEQRERLHRQELPREDRGRLSRRVYPQRLFHQMLEVLGSRDNPGPWREDVLYNLGRFSDLITKFESVHQWVTPAGLETLARFLNSWASGRTDDGGQDELSVPNAVQILTVHGAKGLEWPVVFIPRVSSYHFPNAYLMSHGPEPFLPKEQFDPHDYMSGEDAERRLWYVGITRARKFLHLTSLDILRHRPTELIKEIRHDYVRGDGKDPSEPRRRGTPRQSMEAELLPTTYSDVNIYWGCPFEYQLRRLMGFSPGVTEAYGYGVQMHNLLMAMHEKATKGEDISEEWIRETVKERFNLRYTNQEVLETFREAAADTLVRYRDKFPEQESYILRAEQPFEFVEGDALVSGSIDLLERMDSDAADGKTIPVGVVDFKTGTENELEEHRRRFENVERQLVLYAIAVRKALNLDPKRAIAYFLGPKDPGPGVEERYEIDIGEEPQKAVRAMVSDAVSGIKAHSFPRRPRETTRCDDCEMGRVCPRCCP